MLVGSGVLTQATLAEETAGFGGRGRRWRVLELRSCWGARLAHRIGSMHLEGCLGVVCSGRIGEGGRLEEVEEWRSLLFGTALGGAKVGACDGAGQEMDCDASRTEQRSDTVGNRISLVGAMVEENASKMEGCEAEEEEGGSWSRAGRSVTSSGSSQARQVPAQLPQPPSASDCTPS
jgi:hypothetical protein